jgi:CarD family transcriptional regulator, regulator of rRNA transcription
MTFVIGEKVVYPNQGIGTIENISSRAFGAQFERFYLLKLLYNSMTVMVPFSNVTNIGLRKITKTNDASRVLAFLGGGKCESPTDWKCRFKENTDKMQTGGLLQVAEVLKSLLVLQGEKPLSFREKKMLDRSRHLLVSELAIAKGVSESEAEALIEKALHKADLTMPAVL